MKGESDEKPVRIGTGSTLSDDADRLESWKEIAAFLRRTERTVMRYEELGMPVHRLPGAKRSRVTASRAELTKWLASEPEPDSDAPVQVTAPESKRSTKRYWIAGAAMAALAATITIGIVLRSTHGPRPPADAKLTENALIALDSDGHTLWTVAFHRKLNTAVPHLPWKFAIVADLLGDGDHEVLAIVPYAMGPNPEDGTECEIICFSSRGKRLWSYLPRETFQFGAHEIHGPWQVLDPIISARGVIYVALIHDTWGNSFVVELDPKTGHSTLRYVNTGTTRMLGEARTSGATYLIASGFNNEFDGGSAAFIDERKSFAASPQKQGTRFKCTSCPEGVPDYYLVFPQSEGNRARKLYENPVKNFQVIGNEIQFEKYEWNEGDVDAVYLLGLEPRIHPISLRFGSAYDLEHRELERIGALSHTLAQCPERLHPLPVRMWTPAAGWTELSFGPSGADQ